MRRASRIEALEARFVLAAPVLLNLPDQVTVEAGAPLHIALNGMDADGDELRFQATSSNPNLATLIPDDNRSLSIAVQNTDPNNPFSGVITIELFEDRAPITAGRIAELAASGFYDDVIFHRILPGFVIQGGDPTGTGMGGSGVRFDDEFVAGLRHTSAGIVSMANSGDDTNDSQFFIITTATPSLDFNHSVFGFVTTGDELLAMIESVPRDDDDKPNFDLVMTSVDVINDDQNGVLTVSAPIGTMGTAMVTVTVDDGHGGTAQKVIQVNIVEPTTNARPFLEPQGDVTTTIDTPITFQFHAFDVEGDPIFFDAVPLDNSLEIVSIDNDNGTIIIQPKAGAIGTRPFRIGVRAASGGEFDTQDISVHVVPAAPTEIEFLSDGVADGEGITTRLNNSSDETMQVRISSVHEGAMVRLFAGDTLIGQATVPAGSTGELTEITITTNGTAALSAGVHSLRAEQTLDGVASEASPALELTIDRTSPVFTSAPVSTVNAGTNYVYNVQTDEEENPASLGLTYSLTTAPSGMTINADTGVIQWPTSAGAAGTHSVVVQAVDAVGNAATQSFGLTVNNLPPSLDEIDDATVTEGEALTFTVTGENLSGGQFSLAAGAPSGATIDPTTGAFSWTPGESQGPGEFDVTVDFESPGGLMDSQSFHVSVTEANRTPVVKAIVDRQIEQDETLQVQVNATDPDLPANTLTYDLTQAPEGATINPSTGLITWAPDSLHPKGIANFTVAVDDGKGGAATTSFSVNVVEENLAPVFEEPTDRVIDEGVELRFNLIASDPNGENDVLTFLFGQGGAPSGMTIDPETGEIIWIPTEAQGPGAYDVEVIARDISGLEDKVDFKVTVNEVNRSPQLAQIAGRELTVGETLRLTAPAADPDVPTQTLIYQLLGEAHGATIDPATGAFEFVATTPTGGVPLEFTVEVRDPAGLTAETTFQVTVVEVSEEPQTPSPTPGSSGGGVTTPPTGLGVQTPDGFFIPGFGPRFSLSEITVLLSEFTPLPGAFALAGATDSLDAAVVDDAASSSINPSESNGIADNFAIGPQTSLGSTNTPIDREGELDEEENAEEGDSEQPEVRGQDESLDESSTEEDDESKSVERQSAPPDQQTSIRDEATDAVIGTIELPRDIESSPEPYEPGSDAEDTAETEAAAVAPTAKRAKREPRRREPALTKAAVLALPWVATQLTRNERDGWTCRRPRWRS